MVPCCQTIKDVDLILKKLYLLNYLLDWFYPGQKLARFLVVVAWYQNSTRTILYTIFLPDYIGTRPILVLAWYLYQLVA